MPIERLDHVNLRTNRMAEMLQWYKEILSLSAGERPSFDDEGAWLYSGDVAVVHLVAVDGDSGAGSESALKLEHFAFRASGDAEEFQARLQDKGVSFRRSEIDEMNLSAFNIWDPDGNHIHVDFVSA